MYSRLTPEGRFVSLQLCKVFGWIGVIIIGLWLLAATGGGISKWMADGASMNQVSYVPPPVAYQPRRLITTADLPPVNIPSPINIPSSANMFATNGPTPVVSAPAPEPMVTQYTLVAIPQPLPQSPVVVVSYPPPHKQFQLHEALFKCFSDLCKAIGDITGRHPLYVRRRIRNNCYFCPYLTDPHFRLAVGETLWLLLNAVKSQNRKAALLHGLRNYRCIGLRRHKILITSQSAIFGGIAISPKLNDGRPPVSTYFHNFDKPICVA